MGKFSFGLCVGVAVFLEPQDGLLAQLLFVFALLF